MKWSWRLGRAAGVDVYLHFTFLLLLGWEFFSRALRGDLAGAVWQGLILNIVLFGTVVLHELGHALAARHYGIGTADITLLYAASAKAAADAELAPPPATNFAQVTATIHAPVSLRGWGINE